MALIAIVAAYIASDMEALQVVGIASLCMIACMSLLYGEIRLLMK